MSHYNSSPYHVLKVEDIPTHVSFHHLLTRLSQSSRHIIGCARTADYTSKHLGHTVFFICTSLDDARLIDRFQINFEITGNQPKEVTLVDSVIGRASLPDVAYMHRYERKPVGIHLTGLQRQKFREGTTNYLLTILPAFENIGTVTFFRLNYDSVRRASRSDGFIAYLNQRSARYAGGEGFAIKHLINGREISGTLSFNIPLIILKRNEFLLDHGKAILSHQVEAANQLIIKHRLPQHHESNLYNFPLQSYRDKERYTPSSPSIKSTVNKSFYPIPSTSSAGVVKCKDNKSTSSSSTVSSGKKRLQSIVIVASNKVRKVSAIDNSDDAVVCKSVERKDSGLKPATSFHVPANRRVYNLSKLVPVNIDIPSTDSDSDFDDDDHLVISEDVVLESDVDQSKK
jgi:hypothetical protein